MSTKSEPITDQNASGLRPCRIEPLGVRFPHGIMNVVLMNVRPGFEKTVIDSVDRRLGIYRKDLARVEFASAHGLNTDFDNYGPDDREAVERHVQTCEEEAGTSLVSRAVHATLLGDFQLASIFTSIGYSQRSSLEAVDHVLAQRSIQGGVPVPGIRVKAKDFIYLQQQDPGAFLAPYDHNKAIELGAPKAVRAKPLLTICQLQTAGLIRTTDAANVLLPLLYAIEAKLRHALHGDKVRNLGGGKNAGSKRRSRVPVSGLLLCSSEWNDYTLLLRSTNLNDATRCIVDVLSITLADLMDHWTSLGKRSESNCAMRDPLVGQHVKFSERFCRLVGCLSSEEEKKVPEDARTKNHFFSASTSIPGVLWPFAFHAIEALRAQFDPEGSAHPQAAKAFNKWSIKGSVHGRVYVANQAGRDGETARDIATALSQLESKIPCAGSEQESKAATSGGTPFEDLWWLLGYYDKVIPGAFLAAPPSPSSHNLKDLIASIYYLRWELLKNPPLAWFGDEVSPVLGDSTPLQSLKIETQCRVDFPSSEDNPDYVFHTTSYLQQFFQKCFGVGDPNRPRHRNIMALKRRNVSRHLRAAYLRVSSRLQQALSDPQESAQALELADA